jgi:UPF0755 protein
MTDMSNQGHHDVSGMPGDSLDPDGPLGPVDPFDEPGAPGAPQGPGSTLRQAGRRRRRWPMVLGVSVIAGIVAAGAAGLWVSGQLDPTGPNDPVDFAIPVGATTSEVAVLLADAGVVVNTDAFLIFLRVKGAEPFEAGAYTGLTTNQAAGAVLDVLAGGPAAPEVSRITIPEGLWLDEIGDRVLAAFPEMDRADWDQALTTVRSAYQPEGASLEGLLFPATYEVVLEDRGDATKLVQQMVGAFEAVAADLGLADAQATLAAATGLQLTPYEVITVASMIEAETRVESERPQVARVIYNRLIEGMRLDIDATVLFAIGRRTDALTVTDLDTDSPWNTRRSPGIPPSPISAPGRSSLEAALNPADGNWLYYVLIDPAGDHYFTNDYNDFLTVAEDSRQRGVF